MAFYFYLSTKIIMVFITKSYQDLFGVRSYINALCHSRKRVEYHPSVVIHQTYYELIQNKKKI